MYDATKVVLEAIGKILKKNSNAFRNNFRRGEVYNNGSRGIDCRRTPIVPWEHGEKILKSIKQVREPFSNLFLHLILTQKSTQVKIRGLSGNISFDETGFRRNFTIDIVKMTINSEMTKVSSQFAFLLLI